MGEPRKTPQRSIYVADEPWQAMRRLAFDNDTTSSAVVATLVDWLLTEASPKQRDAIIGKARARS